ncbi:D-aminoacyl-tRNA deacylase [Spirochaeta lutea]|uniref:D-aminoacyl-tRNA deacylase n=1 Tax=Spirochaeta lutea TaxID=1480694 RepID=A0A098R1N0_9SPIO|nr:D-aminoacyl-tRNA deacylase [Spirochaeta lutea]KGE73691.1 hypothetical protein DC28_00155 [Spirochaeta lutea]
MRALLQHVSHCSIRTESGHGTEINHGLLVFIGINDTDKQADIHYIVDKMLALRIFEDEEGKLNKSISDVEGDLLLVSQFTLYGDTRKGRRPSFNKAAQPKDAHPLFRYLMDYAQSRYTLGRVEEGRFQEHMVIKPILQGPISILLDSEKKL